MDRLSLARRLREAVVAAVRRFSSERPAEHPYAFALVAGQAGNYIGFALATEEGLRETATTYHQSGYRYKRRKGERASVNTDRLSVWLRWANPDDGWRYGNFDDSEALRGAMREAFDRGLLTDDGGQFEAFCTDDVLAPLAGDPDWTRDPVSHSIILGFTYGDDPRDFFRSATRANPYPRVMELWSQYWQAFELDGRIRRPS